MPEQAGSTAVTSATPEPTAFESDLGEMFGDYTGGSQDSDTDSAAGTTPAEPAAEPVETEAASAGSESVTEGEGTTPVATDEDPFKDTTAGTYMVNGKPVAVEDIRVFKEGGAVIRPEALPNLYSKLAERDTLAEKFSTRDREYHTLAKVAEWTDSTSGKTYSGPEAAIELRIGNAALLAENKLLVETLTDPEKLYAILTTEQVPDGRGGVRERVIINPTALLTLQRENSLTQRELSAAIRDHYKGVIAEASKPGPAAVDFTTEVPQLVEQIAKSANLDASVLTAADRAMLAKQLPYHAQNGKVSLDWQEMVKERITERAAQKASTQQLVTTTTDAVRKGQANLAAAARGVRQPVKPVTPVKPITPKQQRIDNEGDAFDAMERAAAGALRRAR